MRFLIVGILILGGLWYWFGEERQPSKPTVFENAPITTEPVSVPEASPAPAPEPVKPVVKSIQHEVPFTSQAPTGDWTKSAFQDGCEEASTLMVWMALHDKVLTRDQVKAELLEMAAFQTKKLGHGVDTDVSDTHEYLLKQYFEISAARIVYDFSLQELKEAVMEGLVIVPTNGRALKNPNFTLPGPLQHMLVITGYDQEKNEFITNDPGTRKGEGYRYPEQVLYDAIREYPTGKHLPITTERKAMIVIPLKKETSPRTNASADL